MNVTQKKIKEYIKRNPDVDFDTYLKKQLKNPKNKKVYDEEILKLEIALEIYRSRKNKNMTQAELAKKVSMPQANIARIERGEHLPTLSTLAKISEALGQMMHITFGRKDIYVH